jgi:hypothetical protein
MLAELEMNIKELWEKNKLLACGGTSLHLSNRVSNM